MEIPIGKLVSHRQALTQVKLESRRLQFVVPLGVFLIVLLPRVIGLDVFLTADEDDQIMFASLFLKSILQGDFAGALVLGYPGVPTLALGALGVGLRYMAHYAGWLPLPWVSAGLLPTLDQVTQVFGVFEYPLDFLWWVRLPLALTASLSITGIYFLLRRLLDPKLALLATLVIAFDPLILAHTRIIHVDAPLSYFMFLSFLAFLLYLDRGGWKWLLLSGVCGALAALSKTPAGLLGPILVISGLFYALFPPAALPRAVRWRRLAVALLGWGAIALTAFFALWPAMWTRPTFALTWIIQNIQSVSQSYHPTTGIFWDARQSDQNPFYYLIALPYHLSPLTTAGLPVGLVMIIAGLVGRWRKIASPAAALLPLNLSLVTYVILFIAPISMISRRGDRYMLPAFFAIGLLTVIALLWLAGQLKKWPARLTPRRVVGGLVMIQAFWIFLYHPYYLAYYNPLLNGARTAPYHINIGWGEGLDVAARYLNEVTLSTRPANPAGRPQVAAWYRNQFAPFYHGPTIDLSNESAALTGDYTVFYINQVQRGFPSGEILAYFQQREPLQVVRLGGIPYAWIYPGPVISKNPPPQYAFPVGDVLGGGARLVGVDVPVTTLAADTFAAWAGRGRTDLPLPDQATASGLPVTLYWETLAQINGEHNIYIRLVDDQGNAWGQTDRLILAGLWRPDRWYSDYFIRDEYRLAINPGIPPGTYHFEVGMYDFVTGQSYGVIKNIGALTLTPPDRLPPAEVFDLKPVSVPAGPSLTLFGHDYTDLEAPPGAEIAGKIFWQAGRSLDRDYRLEFAFTPPSDGKKYVVAESLLAPSYPTSQWRRGEIVGSAYRFRVPAVAPPGTYPLMVSVIDPATGQSIGPAITLAALTVEPHERNFELPRNVTPVSAVINDEVELVGYRLDDLTVPQRESFGLTLYWRSLQPARSNYTVFVHVVGPDHVMRGQWDSMPVGGTAPTSGWLPGEVIEDHYEVPVAKDAPPWKYDIFVGMYDSLTASRLPLNSQALPISEDRAWLTRVQVTENKN